MKILDFGRYALGISVAAAMLAGCDGSRPPIGGAGAMPQTPAAAVRTQSWGPAFVRSANGDAHKPASFPVFGPMVPATLFEPG
jgi:hypothetical protein